MLLLILNVGVRLFALAVWVWMASPVFAVVLWFFMDLMVLYHLFIPGAQGIVRVQRRFAAHGREVWLTIDDGPDAVDTPKILEMLREHRAKATFFVIGNRAAAHPELLRAIVAEGHEIGHHTHTHPLFSFWCASGKRLERELDDATAAIVAAIGVAPTRFRSPVGHKNIWLRRALQKRGLVYIGWSARGLECFYRRPGLAVAHVLRGICPGDILLLHEGPAVRAVNRIRVLELTLQQLTKSGYSCVIPAAELS